MVVEIFLWDWVCFLFRREILFWDYVNYFCDLKKNGEVGLNLKQKKRKKEIKREK